MLQAHHLMPPIDLAYNLKCQLEISTTPPLHCEVFRTYKKSHNTKVGPHNKCLLTARWPVTCHVVSYDTWSN
jgi:hypothetical protein